MLKFWLLLAFLKKRVYTVSYDSHVILTEGKNLIGIQCNTERCFTSFNMTMIRNAITA
jgi:hypothetical protein